MVNWQSRLIGRTRKRAEKARETITRLEQSSEEPAMCGYTCPMSNITPYHEAGENSIK